MTPPASWAVATPVLRILPMLGFDRSSSGGGGGSSGRGRRQQAAAAAAGGGGSRRLWGIDEKSGIHGRRLCRSFLDSNRYTPNRIG